MHRSPFPAYVRFDHHYSYFIKLLLQLVAVALISSEEINLGMYYFKLFILLQRSFTAPLSY